VTNFSRRSFLKTLAGLSFLGFAPTPLWADEKGGKRVILIRAFGGWDVTYCMDPRLSEVTPTVHGPDWENPGGGVHSIDNYSGLSIAASAERSYMDAFFSANAADVVVVNGIYMGSIVHPECESRILTGSREDTAADLGALAAVNGGAGYTLPYVDLVGGSRVGNYAAQTGILGVNNQVLALLNRNLPLLGPKGSGREYPLYTPSASQHDAMQTYFQSRQKAWTEAGYRDPRTTQRLSDLAEAQTRKQDLLDNKDLLADNLTFFGGGDLIGQATTAAILLEAGLCHSVAMSTSNSWDTHDNIDNQSLFYESLFAGLGALVEELKTRALYDDTLIVVMSEMTRTPKMNVDLGKDHWPVTSAMLISGSLEGGRTLGGTSEGTLDALPVNLANGAVDESLSKKLGYANFAAGVLHAVGGVPQIHLPNVEVLHGIVD